MFNAIVVLVAAIQPTIIMPPSVDVVRRATPVEQAALEIAAARHLVAATEVSRRDGLPTTALDPRQYNYRVLSPADSSGALGRSGVNQPAAIRWIPEIPDRSATPNHIPELVRALGVGAVLPADSSCADSVAGLLCRIPAGFTNVIAFTAADVKGNTAWVRLFAAGHFHDGRGYVFMNEYECARDGDGWRVTTVRGFGY